jgi:hypothetical protein
MNTTMELLNQAYTIASTIIPTVLPVYQIDAAAMCRPDIPLAGRLRYFYENWGVVDAFTQKLVQEGVSIPVDPLQLQGHDLPDSMPCSTNAQEQHRQELMELIELGVLRLIQEPMVTSSHIFPIPKPDGRIREITETPLINLLLIPEHFRLEGKDTIKGMMRRKDYLLSLDLKSAYYLIPIKEMDTWKLVVRIEGNLYRFMALPMGINIAPQRFTRILQAVIKLIRKHLGYRISGYFDDIILMEKDKTKSLLMTQVTLIILTSLGFVINIKKSNLVPSHVLEHLGIMWNSTSMTASLSQDKKSAVQKKLIRYIKYITTNAGAKLRLLAALNGTVLALRDVVNGAVVRSRATAKWIGDARRQGKAWDSFISLPEDSTWATLVHEELKYWYDQWTRDLGVSLTPNTTPQVHLITDASTYAWGMTAQFHNTNHQLIHQEYFSKNERIISHNAQEALAMAKGVEWLISAYNVTVLRVTTDNEALFKALKKGGSTHGLFAIIVNTTIKLCTTKGVTLLPDWTPASNLTYQDTLSRQIYSRRDDWMMHKTTVDHIRDQLLQTRVDLFASNNSKTHQLYMAPTPQPDAIGTDAFNYNWRTISKMFGPLWIHPPWKHIGRCLIKCLSDKTSALILVPFRPTAPWWPLLQAMTTRSLYIPPDQAMLHRRIAENMWLKRRIPYIACLVSPTYLGPKLMRMSSYV